MVAIDHAIIEFRGNIYTQYRAVGTQYWLGVSLTQRFKRRKLSTLHDRRFIEFRFRSRRTAVSQRQLIFLGIKNKSTARLALSILSATVLCGLLGADWPEWRGPSRDGISKETGLRPQWPVEGPKLLWQQSGLGDGYSTPSIV